MLYCLVLLCCNVFLNTHATTHKYINRATSQARATIQASWWLLFPSCGREFITFLAMEWDIITGIENRIWKPLRFFRDWSTVWFFRQWLTGGSSGFVFPRIPPEKVTIPTIPNHQFTIGWTIVKWLAWLESLPKSKAAKAILLFVLPTVRFLKLLRYFETIRLLIDAWTGIG